MCAAALAMGSLLGSASCCLRCGAGGHTKCTPLHFVAYHRPPGRYLQRAAPRCRGPAAWRGGACGSAHTKGGCSAGGARRAPHRCQGGTGRGLPLLRGRLRLHAWIWTWPSACALEPTRAAPLAGLWRFSQEGTRARFSQPVHPPSWCGEARHASCLPLCCPCFMPRPTPNLPRRSRHWRRRTLRATRRWPPCCPR